jgi:Na+-transporting NADH:ubiquinone oxidoreductase subunit NqrB
LSIDNIIGDLVAVSASLVALYYVFRMWRMIHAMSRLVLLVAMLYMVATRFVILALEIVDGDSWIELHRSIVIVPQYFLFALAFGLTYYELKNFHFDIPRDPNEEE